MTYVVVINHDLERHCFVSVETVRGSLAFVIHVKLAAARGGPSTLFTFSIYGLERWVVAAGAWRQQLFSPSVHVLHAV